jgi:hypothetical protein
MSWIFFRFGLKDSVRSEIPDFRNISECWWSGTKSSDWRKTMLRKYGSTRSCLRQGLRLERLEERTVFAGNVVMALNPATNTIALTGDLANNAVEVRALAAGGVQVVGVAGTTVNGNAFAIAPMSTPNLQGLLGTGNDRMFIHDVVLGSINVQDFSGNNTITVRRTHVHGKVSIAFDEGMDTVDFEGKVQGDVVISTGHRDDRVLFRGDVGILLSAAAPAPLSPTLRIATGLGNDNVRVSNSHIFPNGGGLTVNTGAGDDSFESANNIIDGVVRLQMEAGNDQAVISNTDAAFADYKMGAGNDQLRLDLASLVLTPSLFDGGGGNDLLDRGGNAIGAPINFEVLI